MEILYREIKEDDILTQKKKYLNYLSYFLTKIKKKKRKKYLKCIMKICLNFAKMEVRYY